MTANRRFMTWMSAIGAILVIFLALPIACLLFGTPPVRLIQTLAAEEVRRSLGLTFTAALLSTLIGALFGVPLAYVLAKRDFPGKRLVEALIDLPVVIPHTAAGIALLLVLGSRGILGAPLATLGVYFTDSLPGIVAAMMFVGVPYLVNMSREAFASVDREMEATALVEGATTWGAFRYVSLPLARRGLVAGAMMMWARGVSEFGAVVILAYHPKIAPTLIFELFQGFGLNAAQPVAALLLLSVVLLFGLLRRYVMGDPYR